MRRGGGLPRARASAGLDGLDDALGSRARRARGPAPCFIGARDDPRGARQPGPGGAACPAGRGCAPVGRRLRWEPRLQHADRRRRRPLPSRRRDALADALQVLPLRRWAASAATSPSSARRTSAICTTASFDTARCVEAGGGMPASRVDAALARARPCPAAGRDTTSRTTVQLTGELCRQRALGERAVTGASRSAWISAARASVHGRTGPGRRFQAWNRVSAPAFTTYRLWL